MDAEKMNLLQAQGDPVLNSHTGIGIIECNPSNAHAVAAASTPASAIHSEFNACMFRAHCIETERQRNAAIAERDSLTEKLAALKVELEAAKVDADRYRWLREQDSESKIRVFVDLDGGRKQYCFDDIDTAIDAARTTGKAFAK